MSGPIAAIALTPEQIELIITALELLKMEAAQDALREGDSPKASARRLVSAEAWALGAKFQRFLLSMPK